MFGLWATALQARFGGLEIQSSDVPVLVELYTSQGCSSCPPADRVLEELAQHENIITLGCHVTYWDRLGWPDELGRDFCDARQRSYAHQSGSSRIYTPQMVVNGKHEFVGSYKSDASKYIAQEIKAAQTQKIAVRAQGNRLHIQLPQLNKRGDYRIWMIGYKRDHISHIPRGENRGRNVRYVNTMLRIDKISSWAGEAKTLSAVWPNDPTIDGIAIIAQRTTHGPIVAAGKAEK